MAVVAAWRVWAWRTPTQPPGPQLCPGCPTEAGTYRSLLYMNGADVLGGAVSLIFYIVCNKTAKALETAVQYAGGELH